VQSFTPASTVLHFKPSNQFAYLANVQTLIASINRILDTRMYNRFRCNPILDHDGRLIQINAIDPGSTSTRLEVYYHCGIGREFCVATIAFDRARWLAPLSAFTHKTDGFAYILKVNRALKMLFASCANIVLFQTMKVLLRSRHPRHPVSVIATLADNMMLCLSMVL